MHYHHTISALVRAQGFTAAIALYQELRHKASAKKRDGQDILTEDSFVPHPLTLVPLLQVLSQWDEVTHAGAMMALCEEVVQIATALSRMSDESFRLLHGGAGATVAGEWE